MKGKGIGSIGFVGTLGIVFIIIGLSGAESSESVSAEESVTMDSVTELPMTSLNESCSEEGIYKVQDSTTAFYKCVLDNPPVSVSDNKTIIFRKYNLECPNNTYFDLESRNCQDIKPPTTSTTQLPLVIGSFFATLKNSATGDCLRSNLKDHVFASTCNGGKLEGWERYNDGRIKNAETRKCLEGNEDGHVFNARCNGGETQRWKQDEVKRFVNLGSKRCLASNVVGFIHTALCNNGVFKRWD